MVEFLYDFGSPNAYLVHRAIPQIEARSALRFSYVPVLLGGIFKLTNNQPPMVAFGPVKNKMAYEQLEMTRFIARYQIAFRFNPNFPVNTVSLMRGAIAAGRLGLAGRYIETVFFHMWQEPKNMGEAAVFDAALREAGLPAAEIAALTADQSVKDELLRNTEQAVERGVFGSPSFFAGNELFFGKERLAQIEELAGTA